MSNLVSCERKYLFTKVFNYTGKCFRLIRTNNSSFFKKRLIERTASSESFDLAFELHWLDFCV